MTVCKLPSKLGHLWEWKGTSLIITSKQQAYIGCLVTLILMNCGGQCLKCELTWCKNILTLYIPKPFCLPSFLCNNHFLSIDDRTDSVLVTRKIKGDVIFVLYLLAVVVVVILEQQIFSLAPGMAAIGRLGKWRILDMPPQDEMYSAKGRTFK